MVRITHVIDLISQEKHGGAAQACYHLAEAQARLGHDDVAIVTTDYQAENQEAPEGVKLVKYPCLINLGGHVRIAPKMIFNQFDCDIIHLHTYRTFVNMIAANSRKPYVIQAHGCMPMHSVTKRLQDVVWKNLIFNRASRYIATTDTERQQYLDEGAKRDLISIFPVGIDLREFANLPARQHSDKKKILFLGRLHEIKGIDLLIEAFSRINNKNIILQIAGNDCGYEETAKELAKDTPNIEFLGPVYGKDKLQLFVNANLFVVPSRYESWGITFLESLACGTPVLMTDACDASSQLPIPCGKVTHRNSSNFAYAMDEMLHDSRYSPDFELGMKSRKLWASRFDWVAIASRIMGIYEDVLSE